jgi:hypothetical protein
MKLIEVTTPAHQKEFIEMAVRLYKSEKNWIRPIDADIEGLFHSETNKLFRNGAKAKRWLLQNENGEIIGRIAAFVNPKMKEKQPTGGVGFFECIDNQEAAFLLLDTAKAWLQSEGMEAMDGPINFGINGGACWLTAFPNPIITCLGISLTTRSFSKIMGSNFTLSNTLTCDRFRISVLMKK